MIPQSYVTTIVVLVGVLCPMAVGHIPQTALQWTVSIAGLVAAVAAKIVSCFAPNAADVAMRARAESLSSKAGEPIKAVVAQIVGGAK
jgi:uncharacterized membrane protein (DUF441 family)